MTASKEVISYGVGYGGIPKGASVNPSNHCGLGRGGSGTQSEKSGYWVSFFILLSAVVAGYLHLS